MRSLIFATIFFSVLGLVESAHAMRERIILDMYDTVYRGQSVIPLKREILNQYPNKRLNRSRLIAVKVIAKSRHGRGEVALTVDGYEQDRMRAMGGPQQFRSNAPHTYDRMRLQNYGSSQGRWQLAMRGNIKVKRVVVVVESQNRRGGRDGRGGVIRRPRTLNYVSLGREKIDWHALDYDTFNVYQNNVFELKLTASGEDIRVSSVVVNFAHGPSQRISMLEGKLKENRTKVAELMGRDIISVTIRAQSIQIGGSRGKLALVAGVR